MEKPITPHIRNDIIDDITSAKLLEEFPVSVPINNLM